MLQLIAFLLVLSAPSEGSEVTNANDQVDGWIAKLTTILRYLEVTSFQIPPGMINKNVTFSNGTLVGLDSFHRTGDCTKEVAGTTKVTYDVHIGLGLLTVAFGNITIDGEQMSAFFRVRNNSVHVKVALYDDDECWTSLQAFDVERFEDVEFGSSRPEFDGMQIDRRFLTTLLKILNGLFWKKRPDIADLINGWVCGYV